MTQKQLFSLDNAPVSYVTDSLLPNYTVIDYSNASGNTTRIRFSDKVFPSYINIPDKEGSYRWWYMKRLEHDYNLRRSISYKNLSSYPVTQRTIKDHELEWRRFVISHLIPTKGDFSYMVSENRLTIDD